MGILKFVYFIMFGLQRNGVDAITISPNFEKLYRLNVNIYCSKLELPVHTARESHVLYPACSSLFFTF